MSGDPSIFDLAAFRASWPAFADPTAWTDAGLIAARSEAQCHIAPAGDGRLRDCLPLALDLMTAHIATLDKAQATGSAVGIVQSATVDKVSVTTVPPPVKSQFQWWLCQTTYGTRLLSLLKSKAAGGLYVGGLPAERAGFRKAGGVFRSGTGRS